MLDASTRVARHATRRRVTSFAFPSGGAPTGASADSTLYKVVTIRIPSRGAQLAPPMCRYARMPVRFPLGVHLTFLTRTQYPHRQRPRRHPSRGLPDGLPRECIGRRVQSRSRVRDWLIPDTCLERQLDNIDHTTIDYRHPPLMGGCPRVQWCSRRRLEPSARPAFHRLLLWLKEKRMIETYHVQWLDSRNAPQREICN